MIRTCVSAFAITWQACRSVVVQAQHSSRASARITCFAPVGNSSDFTVAATDASESRSETAEIDPRDAGELGGVIDALGFAYGFLLSRI